MPNNTDITIDIHPAAAIFPMMSDSELKELALSIKEHGLRERIQAIVTHEKGHDTWNVLDGRNRLEAIRRYIKNDDGSALSNQDLIVKFMIGFGGAAMAVTPEEYVVMANIERRNLTAPQRKELAGKLTVMISEAQKEKPKSEQIDATQKAADAAGVSRRTAATAAKENKEQVAKGPELAPAPKGSKDEPKKEQVFKPASILARLSTSLNEVKKLSDLAKWEDTEVLEALKTCKDLVEILDTENERRRAKAIAEAEQLLAAAREAAEGGPFDMAQSLEEAAQQ